MENTDQSLNNLTADQLIFVGDNVSSRRNRLDVYYPIENGIIKNWDEMTLLWKYCFQEKLKIDPQESKLLLTESPNNTTKNREKTVEIMFEEFGFHGLYIAVQSILTLYAQGLMTGVVVDSGEGVTNIMPVFDGFALPHLNKRLEISGREITRHLIKLLNIRGYSFNRSADLEVVREMKEKYCYIG